MTKIVVAGADGCSGSAFIGASELLALARDAIAQATGGEPPFTVVTASPTGSDVVDGDNRRLAVATSFEEISASDAILAPQPSLASGCHLSPERPAGAAAWLRRQHAHGAAIYAAGPGAFLLGEAGLLDGRRCAVGWRIPDELKRRYPRADVMRAALIEDRRIVTAAAPLGWIDLALHAIRTLCGEAAARIAEELTVSDPSDERGAYRPQGYLCRAPIRSSARRSVSFARPARPPCRRSTSRTLHRRLKLASGESPKAFIDRVRIENAQTLLETSAMSVKEFAVRGRFHRRGRIPAGLPSFEGHGARRLSRARTGAHPREGPGFCGAQE